MFLVTGGSGFIGSNMVAALSDKGADVAVCDWLKTDQRWRNLAKHRIMDMIAPERLAAWLESRPRLEGVVHMGANSSTTETDVDNIADNNLRLSYLLWDWCTATRTPLIYASSAATYGDGGERFVDDADPAALARLRPLNAYGWSKLAIDRRNIALAERGLQPPQWAGLKFFNVYGPNEYHKGSMMSVIAQNYVRVARGETMRLFKSHRPDYADGGQLRDFVYVRDCVETMMWLIDHPSVCGLFNLGTGRARSWLDLARALFAACGKPENIAFIPMPDTIAHKYQYFTEAKMDKLRAAGYDKPFTNLEDGVDDYVGRFLSQPDPYR